MSKHLKFINYANPPVTAEIFDPDGRPAPFVVRLFGVPLKYITTDRDGGTWPIKAGLGRRLVAEGYTGSAIHVKERS